MDNYRSTEKNGVRIKLPLLDRQIVTEISSDFSLPDYQTEIKRLLRVRATVSPPDKYVGAGSAEFSGTVDYCILYAGNDGALYSTSQTGEYRFSVPVELPADFEIGDGIFCDVETVPDMSIGRVVAPRRLSVKCRLRSHVRLFGTRVLEESISGASCESIQRLKADKECARVFFGTGEALQLGDEILCDNDTLRVISADAQVYVTEAVAGSGCVNCRGEACLKLLCTHEGEGEPFVQLRRVPFSQSVSADGVEVNCEAVAHGVCSDISISVEDGRIVCEVAIMLSVYAQRNESVCYTRDVYSTDAAGEVSYTELALPVAIKCVSGNFSLNTTLSMEEVGVHAGQTVADLHLTPVVLGLEQEGGRYILSGRCRAHAVLCEGEDATAQEFEIPFRYVSEGSAERVTDYDAFVTVISSRAREDGERISVDAELSVALMTRGESSVRPVKSACFGERIPLNDSSIVICYPTGEDTLWTVAKRYHRSVEAILQMNPLPGSAAADAVESLTGVSYLLV